MSCSRNKISSVTSKRAGRPKWARHAQYRLKYTPFSYGERTPTFEGQANEAICPNYPPFLMQVCGKIVERSRQARDAEFVRLNLTAFSSSILGSPLLRYGLWTEEIHSMSGLSLDKLAPAAASAR